MDTLDASIGSCNSKKTDSGWYFYDSIDGAAVAVS